MELTPVSAAVLSRASAEVIAEFRQKFSEFKCSAGDGANVDKWLEYDLNARVHGVRMEHLVHGWYPGGQNALRRLGVRPLMERMAVEAAPWKLTTVQRGGRLRVQVSPVLQGAKTEQSAAAAPPEERRKTPQKHAAKHRKRRSLALSAAKKEDATESAATASDSGAEDESAAETSISEAAVSPDLADCGGPRVAGKHHDSAAK
jgi:hypothetical protein